MIMVLNTLYFILAVARVLLLLLNSLCITIPEDDSFLFNTFWLFPVGLYFLNLFIIFILLDIVLMEEPITYFVYGFVFLSFLSEKKVYNILLSDMYISI